MPKMTTEWTQWLMRQGFVAVLVVAILWFVGYKMVLPTQEASIAATAKMAEAFNTQTTILREHTSILREIRDRQNR